MALEGKFSRSGNSPPPPEPGVAARSSPKNTTRAWGSLTPAGDWRTTCLLHVFIVSGGASVTFLTEPLRLRLFFPERKRMVLSFLSNVLSLPCFAAVDCCCRCCCYCSSATFLSGNSTPIAMAPMISGCRGVLSCTWASFVRKLDHTRNQLTCLGWVQARACPYTMPYFFRSVIRHGVC